ncbi:serine/threonine-protein kinase [Streptomyces sp. NPDC005805]|uniref:serine/threonine-protein kinase n=1 Tax=Streptomyces sp. NPDC005805 TaxID=3157068 RepID=UPI00340F703F
MPPLRSAGPFPEAEHPEHAGQYRLEDCLGTGGMGVVHLATSASGLRLAVKVIHAEHASDPEFRARFRQEVAAARQVSGAFTAPVVDADPDAGRPWMATLFIDGPTLADEVKRNGPLDPVRLRRVGAGLAEALRDIHRAGVVHRDLKPGNVMLAQDGPKVIDFGISRPRDSDLRTETGKLIGTPPFMAPEQFQRPREVGPEADVFALGAVLVHAATGRGPFDSDSPYIVAYQIVHDEPDLAGVPDDLVPLLSRCLAKDPADRPTPYELMVALRASSPSAVCDTEAHLPAQREAVGDGGPGRDAGPGRAEGAGRALSGPGPGGDASPQGQEPGPAALGGRTRHRRVTVLAAAVVLAAAGAVTAVTMTGSDEGRPPAPRSAAPAPPTAWDIPLGDRPANRVPVCTAADAAVYCAAPGVAAARLDPATGAVRWSVPGRAAGTGPGDADASAPVLAGGLLQVTAPGGARHEARDPATGAVRWHRDVPGRAVAVRQDGDTVLLASADGRVRALDAATGAQRWTRPGPPGAQWLLPPRPDEPALAVAPSADGTSTVLRAHAPGSGRTLWERRLPGLLTPVESTGEGLFLLASDHEGYTTAVVRVAARGAGGAVRRVALDAPVDQAQAAVVGGTAYVAGRGGSLLAVDTGTGGGRGAQRWRLETSVAQLSRPAADARTVYVSAGDGRLLAVDAVDGRLIGQSRPRMGDGRYPPLLPAPSLTPGRVHATAPDGTVFSLGTGAPATW